MLKSIPLGTGLIGSTAADGTAKVIDVLAIANNISTHFTGMQSALVVPIKTRDQILGVIVALGSQPAVFSQGSVKLIDTLAGQLATSIERNRWYLAELQRRTELEGLVSISKTMRQAMKSDTLKTLIVEGIAKLMQADSVMLLVEQDGRAIPAAASGDNRKHMDQKLYVKADAFQINQIVSASNATEIDQAIPKTVCPALLADAQAFIQIPLLFSNEIIGILVLTWKLPRVIGDTELRLITASGEISASSLHRIILLEKLQKKVHDHSRELEAIHAINTIFSEAVKIEELLSKCLDFSLSFFGSKTGIIRLFDVSNQAKRSYLCQKGLPKSLQPLFGFTAQIAPAPEQEVDLPLAPDPMISWNDVPISLQLEDFLHRHSSCFVEIRTGGQRSGGIQIFGDSTRIFSSEERHLLETISQQITLGMEVLALRETAQHAALMGERQRLARELHDSITQDLYSMTLLAASGRKAIPAGNLEKASQLLEYIEQASQQALKDMRLLIYELRPNLLEQIGLVGALRSRLESVEKRAGVQVEHDLDESIRLSPQQEIELYGILQEALNNVLKHANAGHIYVRISREGTVLLCEVTDDGKGFNPNTLTSKGGIGLASLKERTTRIGADLRINSIPGKGTSVMVAVSLTKA